MTKKSAMKFHVGERIRFKTDTAARRCMVGLTSKDEMQVIKTGISVIRCELPDGEHILIDSWEFKDLARVDDDETFGRDEEFLLLMMSFAVEVGDKKYFHELADELNQLKEG